MAAVQTFKGRDLVTALLSTSTLKQVGWGSGGIAGGPFTAATSDVAAFSEASEARVAGTQSVVTTTTTNDTYQVAATITAGGAKTITEVLVSDSATKPFSTTVAAAGSANGSAVGTGLNVAASYTPANGTSIQVRTEVLGVTAGTGSTALTVTRGQNGSTAIATIATGDQVTLGNAPGVATANASLYLHADHGATTLALNDSIAYTVKIAYS